MEAAELINRCKAGNDHALHLLYDQYKPKLLNICKHYTKGNDVAEDLLHDAFVVILTSLDKLEDPEKLESWMVSIVRNVGCHYCEHLKKEQVALQQIEKDNEYIMETALTPDYDQLRVLVSQLPQGYQQVFRLSVFEGLSHQEISQLLGIAPHSSSSQLSHARQMLQTLIKQSWMLILLLIAIPIAIWKLLPKEESDTQLSTARKTSPKPFKPEPVVEIPHDKPVYASINKKKISHDYQTEAVIQPDSIPYQTAEIPTKEATEMSQTPEKETKKDSAQPITDHSIALKPVKAEHSWKISVAYNRQIGHNEDYLAATTIGNGSFDSNSNSFIPIDYSFSNWIDYNFYLNNLGTDSPDAPSILDDPETRSLMNIATQNSAVNGGNMEAHYEYQLPVTIQLMLSRQLSKRLSIETGLSYTRQSSTISTGNKAYIQERQRLHYLGIPLHFGWQWYNKAHISLYSSVGAMWEVPIHATNIINHIDNAITTFQKEETLSVPCQLSTTLGLGLQYEFTPHFGIYIEPSLQYFFDDGSDLKTYRTEHPLQITLPLGIRFSW